MAIRLIKKAKLANIKNGTNYDSSIDQLLTEAINFLKSISGENNIQ